MKALVKKERSLGLWMEDVPFPTIGENDVLIKTHKTSICGTDLHIYNWDMWAQKTIPIPMIIGHEFMGEIAAIGSQVKGLKVGMRVSGEGHIVCHTCMNCLSGKQHLCIQTQGLGVNRPGCFTEYFAFPASNVFILPDTISDDQAAIFDPLGNAVHTALTFRLTGEDVLITGAGPIGIMAAVIARQAGAQTVVITDINEYRLDLAKKMGIMHTVNVQHQSLDQALKEWKISGFGVGFEMSGHANGLNTLLEKVQHGGKIALLGIIPEGTAINWDLVIFKMLTIQGIYGREIFGTWFQMVRLLESGLDLSPLVTHHFPFHEFQKGFDVMLSGQSGKIILDW
jgi:threonine 3-dehydrogenase